MASGYQSVKMEGLQSKREVQSHRVIYVKKDYNNVELAVRYFQGSKTQIV
jgi:hypothetical protein